MKHEKTFAAIDKLKDVELELHRLKNALEMANKAIDAIRADEREALEALTQQARRPWQNLTDEEIIKIISSNNSTGLWQIAIQIESALKSKNT